MPIEKLLLALRRSLGARFRLIFPTSNAINPGPLNHVEAPYVRHVRQIIEMHLAEAHFSVGALCRACHTTQPQLYRKIVALTGCSPVHFIHYIRLQKALELLRETDLNIAEIAYETGFSSPAYFTRLFAKTYGLPPSEYRKKGSPKGAALAL